MAMEVFEKTGVLNEGHFRLTSGRHSDKYMQCGRVFERPDSSGRLCAALAELFKNDGVETVAGPAIGAVIMAYEVARQLGCRDIFAERENGKLTFRRGFTVRKGERILVVEDAVTTGGTVQELVDLCRENGAEVVGVGAFVDRSGGNTSFGVPFRALASLTIESWEADDCPLCKAGIPIIKPGSRQTAV